MSPKQAKALADDELIPYLSDALSNSNTIKGNIVGWNWYEGVSISSIYGKGEKDIDKEDGIRNAEPGEHGVQ